MISPRLVARALVVACALPLLFPAISADAARHRRRSSSKRKAVPSKPAPEAVLSEWKTGAPLDGLVAYWPADGNAADVAGKFNGSPSPSVTYAPGKAGLAFQLDGTSAFVGVPFNAAFDVDPQKQFTVASWVCPETVGHYQAIFVKAAPRGPWEYGIIIDPNGHFYSGRDANDVAQATTVIVPGTWYHVAVTYDAGAITTYVNGVQEAVVHGVEIGRSNAGLCIGHKGETSVVGEDPDWFQGKIDDLRFYNRALSADEVKTLYSAIK